MDLKQLFNDDRAVSPVIGVVLMIAVTVILAAIVAAFALGMGSNTSAAPQASFQYTWDNSGTTPTLTIADAGGDKLKTSNMKVYVDGTENSMPSTYSGSTISAGDQFKISNSTLSNTIKSGSKVRIVYTTDNGQDTTLSTYTVP